MKHQELVNHIEGSYLKRQYLEAFLVQSAYIESLVKLYFDLTYFSATSSSGELISDENDKRRREAFLKVLSSHFDRTSLAEIVRILEKSGSITKEQAKLLENYRIKRNKVLHELVFEMSKGTFENDLKEVCDIGKTIVLSDEFANISTLVQRMEVIFEKKSESQQQSKDAA